MPSGAVTDASMLMGREFLVTAASGLTLVPDTVVRLTFTDEQLGISAGCNSMGTTWSIDQGRLTTGTDMGSTAMACDQPRMDQDAAIASFIVSSPEATLVDDTLTLATADITLTLTDREVADPDRPLVGIVWIADTLMTDDAVSTLPQGATATLTIADGIAAVSTGCNSGSAPVTITGDVITFGPMTLTEIGCEGDAAALEQIVVSTLRGELTVTIEAGRLTLVDADGSGLGFTAAP
jgi:heat shock protein HslJ